ncbi:MAG: glycosyltransferase [Hyphomonadaceae bacterium]
MHAVKLLLDWPGFRRQRESVHDNVFWRGAQPRMSVCVPASGRDVSALLAALSASKHAALVEFIVHDDGRCSQDVLAQMQASAGHVRAAVRIVSSRERLDGMAARGAAAAHARTSWVMLLDADAEADAALISTYLEAIDKADDEPHARTRAKAG